MSISQEPVIRADWLESGCHINAVGSHSPTAREIDGETMRVARVIVDSREANLSECGDCLIPIAEGLFDESHVSDEIGQVLAGLKPGRVTREEITVYQSCGLAVQDVAAARRVYENALATGVGITVNVRELSLPRRFAPTTRRIPRSERVFSYSAEDTPVADVTSGDKLAALPDVEIVGSPQRARVTGVRDGSARRSGASSGEPRPPRAR